MHQSNHAIVQSFQEFQTSKKDDKILFKINCIVKVIVGIYNIKKKSF